jgi:tetratricopeptide (TPR) repeat protein
VRLAQLLPVVVIALPALALVLWPFLRQRGAAVLAPSEPADPRLQSRLELEEEKAAIYRALRELAFDHEAGHLSDDDHADLRGRYEARAADALRALDALGPAPVHDALEDVTAAATTPVRRGWTRSPAAVTVGALLLLVFGVTIGLGIGRYTEPDQTVIPPGSRLPVPAAPGSGAMTPEAGRPATSDARAPIAPEMLAGMLRAARQSLSDGRYQEAIAAYQAVLKRDAKNVDAMTHLGLIVAIGGHADTALETWDKALQIDPAYAPAHLYRGQVLYEVKHDYPGAIRAWERFAVLVPQGEDHERVKALLNQARAKQTAR